MSSTSMETDETIVSSDIIGKVNNVLNDKITLSEATSKDLIFGKYKVVKDSLKSLLEAHVSIKSENDLLKARMDKLELAIKNQSNTKVQPSQPLVTSKPQPQRANPDPKQPLINKFIAPTQGNFFAVLQKSGENGDDDDDDADVFLPKDPEVRKTLSRVKRKLLSSPIKPAKDTKGGPSTSAPQKKKARKNFAYDSAAGKNRPVNDITAANQSKGTQPVDKDGKQKETATTSDGEETPIVKPSKIFKPPPIKIIGMQSIYEIKGLISSIVTEPPILQDSWFVKVINNEIFSIISSNDDTYRAIRATLEANKVNFYTYENKNTRPIRVIVRGLHFSNSSEEILEDLKTKEFPILRVDQMIIKERKEIKEGDTTQIKIKKVPIGTFTLTFANGTDIEKIFKINSICNVRVKIEPLKVDPTVVPQCIRCQGFRHTKNGCYKHPVCVRCAGPHLSSACPSGKFIEKPVCANCNEQHPASYRGCPVAKQESADRKAELAKKKQPKGKFDGEASKIQKGVSYSDRISGKKSVNNAPGNQVQNGNQRQVETMSLLDLERSIDMIMSKLDKINAIAERLARLENAVSSLQYPSLGRRGRK